MDQSAYEDKLIQGGLLTPHEEVGSQWANQFGTEDKKIANHRKARQEVVRDLIAGQNHHDRFVDCLDALKGVDTAEPNAGTEIAKWKGAAELHLKAMGKYVPDVKAVTLDVTSETEAAAKGISRAAEIIAAITGTRIPHDDEGTDSGGSVVSTQVRAEAEGS